MVRKEYDPAIAARIKKSTYDYICSIADRRIVTVSSVVAEAIYDYEEKCKRIEGRRLKNAEQ